MSQGSPTEIECTTFAKALIMGGGIITDAFRATFPDSIAKGNSLHVAASKFHSQANVQLRIARMRVEANEKADEGAIYSVNDKKRWLIDIVKYGSSEEVVNTTRTPENADPQNKQRNPSSAVAAIKELNLMDGDHAAIKSKAEIEVTTDSFEDYMKSRD